MPSWDNASRKKGSFLAFKRSTPSLYYKWLKYVVSNFVPYSKDENLLFINFGMFGQKILIQYIIMIF